MHESQIYINYPFLPLENSWDIRKNLSQRNAYKRCFSKIDFDPSPYPLDLPGGPILPVHLIRDLESPTLQSYILFSLLKRVHSFIYLPFA